MQPTPPAPHPFRRAASLVVALCALALSALSGTAAAAETSYTVTDTTTVGNLVIVDWQQSQEGDGVTSGRTLITIENGEVVEVTVLNPSDVAPRADAALASVPAEPAGQYVIVDERGIAFVPEQTQTAAAVAIAGAEARAWPNFDSTTITT